MKRMLRKRVSAAATFIEIAISAVMMLGVVIAFLGLLQNLIQLFTMIPTYNEMQDAFDHFLKFALELIIVIEFVKMLAKHTAESAVEVLVFVIAKRVIVENINMYETLVGVLALSVLFIVKYKFDRKYADLKAKTTEDYIKSTIETSLE